LVVAIKIFAINLPSQPFLGCHLVFHIFFHNDLLGGRTLLFYSWAVFGLDIISLLRSGMEHCCLRFNPSQSTLVENKGTCSYLEYKEDVSKTNQGGLKYRKMEPKEAIQYANIDNPDRCIARLYKLYKEKCPPDLLNYSFYLQPISLIQL